MLPVWVALVVVLVSIIAGAGWLWSIGARTVVLGCTNKESESHRIRVGGTSMSSSRSPHANPNIEEDGEVDGDHSLVGSTTDQEGRDGDGGVQQTTSLTRLQKRKLEKEREKAERRQALDAARDARRERDDEEQREEEEQKARESELLAREEAALRELREEKKRQEDAEYQRWVGNIGVEQRGELGEASVDRTQAAVVAFLTSRAQEADAAAMAALARAKGSASTITPGDSASSSGLQLLVLQDVARDHQLSVEALVGIIEDLLRQDHISGVFDDRGRFLFITHTHYTQIAAFLKQRGRVSLPELAYECNRIIAL